MTIPEIISQMTLEEKAALLTGEDSWHIRNCPRLGMERTMVSDGPHGLRKEREDANGGLFKDSIDAVCFPSAVGMASSFHPDALAKLGETLGEECQAEDVSILLGPGVNIKRSPLCGRNFEYFSEDPYLTGICAVQITKGVQENHPVRVCPKHFAVNEQETYRRGSAKKRYDAVDSILTERALRELYLKPFEMLVRDAGVSFIMTSFNKINGVLAAGNRDLCTHILREEWNFDGVVVTDWGDMDIVADGGDAVAAGNDIVMPGGPPVIRQILQAYQERRITRKDLERSVARLLHVLKLFEKGERI